MPLRTHVRLHTQHITKNMYLAFLYLRIYQHPKIVYGGGGRWKTHSRDEPPKPNIYIKPVAELAAHAAHIKPGRFRLIGLNGRRRRLNVWNN